MSSTQIPTLFSQGVGYGIIVGVGAIFAISMSLISLGLSRYFAEVQTSEMFMTAKHSVRTGLTASAVVSSWTIAATLLTSTTFGYEYGVSGPFWYGAGASVQILLFSVLAIELKRKAPNAHTFLEVVKIRYGPAGHITLALYCLVFQLSLSVNLLVGGSGIFANLTGMSSDAACFLFPLGVMIYTLFGGMKATFLTDWVHTVVIYCIMLLSIFTVYATSNLVGSPGKMYDLLWDAAKLHPVDGNAEGSYLTMRSVQGGYVGLIFVGSGFSAAVDSQLFQKAIAADPASTLGGYLLGGSCWFTIPFVMATTFGLTAAAVEHLPQFPTYPNRMSAYETATGMAMPYAAVAVLGKGGGIAILLMVFMAVTSAMSSETMATAALLTYDCYHAYINPKANGKQLIQFSHWVVVGFGIVVAGIAVGLNHAGFSVNYLTTCIGIIVDSAIIPMACTLLWKKQSTIAFVGAAVISSAAAIIAWLLVAHTNYGAVTLDTTSQNLPLAAGNMMSLTGPIVLTPLLTYIWPQNFDWELLKQIRVIDDDDEETTKGTRTLEPVTHDHGPEEGKRLLKARNRAAILSVVMALCYLVFWPTPMYGSGYVFSKPFFIGWIIVCFLWAWYASLTITLLPLWEGRKSILKFFQFFMGKGGGNASEKKVASIMHSMEPYLSDDIAEDAVVVKESEKEKVEDAEP